MAKAFFLLLNIFVFTVIIKDIQGESPLISKDAVSSDFGDTQIPDTVEIDQLNKQLMKRLS